MPDRIRITLIQDTQPDGSGGTIVDDASAVLPTLPGGGSTLNALAAAFAAIQVHEVDNPDFDPAEPESEDNPAKIPANLFRNIGLHFRKHGEQILLAFDKKTSRAASDQAAEERAVALQGAVTVIEHK